MSAGSPRGAPASTQGRDRCDQLVAQRDVVFERHAVRRGALRCCDGGRHRHRCHHNRHNQTRHRQPPLRIHVGPGPRRRGTDPAKVPCDRPVLLASRPTNSACLAPRAVVREDQHLGEPAATSGCSVRNGISWTWLRAVWSCALSCRPDRVTCTTREKLFPCPVGRPAGACGPPAAPRHRGRPEPSRPVRC